VRLPSASPFCSLCPSSLRFDESILRLIPDKCLINALTGQVPIRDSTCPISRLIRSYQVGLT